jgi:hypothetical protein
MIGADDGAKIAAVQSPAASPGAIWFYPWYSPSLQETTARERDLAANTFIGHRRDGVQVGLKAALVIAAGLALLPTGTWLPSAVAAPLLDDMSPPSWWAIGNPANCRNPRSFYSLELGNGFIQWQNGQGNIDIETIDYSGENEFHTTTARFVHVDNRNERTGQGWTYMGVGFNLVRVMPGGKDSFLLVRCQ